MIFFTVPQTAAVVMSCTGDHPCQIINFYFMIPVTLNISMLSQKTLHYCHLHFYSFLFSMSCHHFIFVAFNETKNKMKHHQLFVGNAIICNPNPSIPTLSFIICDTLSHSQNKGHAAAVNILFYEPWMNKVNLETRSKLKRKIFSPAAISFLLVCFVYPMRNKLSIPSHHTLILPHSNSFMNEW